MDGEQEIACWRDRLSLSVELTAELEQYQGVSATAEMTKIEWYSLCIHLSFSMQGQYQQSKKKEASMEVSEERMPCLLAHWQMAYVQTPQLIHKLCFSSPFFLWGRRTYLEPLNICWSIEARFNGIPSTKACYVALTRIAQGRKSRAFSVLRQGETLEWISLCYTN